MENLHFDDNSPFHPLYNEFLCSTEYIHSIRSRNNFKDRKDPYTPSLFIYSYFTFNTLYNINWRYTAKKDYRRVYYYIPWTDKNGDERYHTETRKIEFYLEFLTNAFNTRFFNEFRTHFMTYIRNYRESIDIKRKVNQECHFYDNTLEKWTEDYLGEFKSKEDTQLDNNAKEFLIKIVKVIINASLPQPSNDDFKKLVNIVYKVRCNLFHGSKNPKDFDGSQMERFVIYAAILSSLNYMLFLHLSTIGNKYQRRYY